MKTTHESWCASLNVMLTSLPPKPAPCNCAPKAKIDPRWFDEPGAVVPVDIETTAALVSLAKNLMKTAELYMKGEEKVVEMLETAMRVNRRQKELLERCENEMRYAGWTTWEADNPQRNGLYEQIKEHLK